VSVQAHWARHLLWDSAHTFGRESGTQTDFDFSSQQFYGQDSYTGETLFLSIASNFSSSGTGGTLLSDDEGVPALIHMYDASVVGILRDVASRTQNGARRSESIRFKDYFDYYPIKVSFIPEELYYFLRDDEDEIRAAFSGYFKIPVADNHSATVEISKDSAGNVAAISVEYHGPVSLGAASVHTGSGIYFALQTGGVTDFSGISGGFGLYLLPAATMLDDQGAELPAFDYHQLSTVYSLHESAFVQSLNLSEDESCLNLITLEDEVLFLTVIELATMTEKQKLPLCEDVGDRWMQATYAEGLMFVLLGDDQFVLAELHEDNTYQIALAHARNVELLNEEFLANGYYRWSNPLPSWDGERLALVTATQRPDLYGDSYDNSYGYDGVCGFVLEIFDASGLTYKGRYESSLDVLAMRKDYNDRCHLIDSRGLSLHW
ncbi:MAG: hypothetical protein LBT32_10120, partial [Peptococcaceae bacterium]|jgi:hypothetical protein|nr:hypothetical protein [Peptococcaceae bacterium]